MGLEHRFADRLHSDLRVIPGVMGSRVENIAGNGLPDLHYWSRGTYALFELKASRVSGNTCPTVNLTPAQRKWWRVAARKGLRAWLLMQAGYPSASYAILSAEVVSELTGSAGDYPYISYDALVERCTKAIHNMDYDPTEVIT